MDDLWLWIILAGLANYKAAHMISQDGDDGPFEIFKRFRAWVGTETWIGKGVHCFSCTSFWGALITLIMIWPILPILYLILAWAAISTISYMVWRYFG